MKVLNFIFKHQFNLFDVFAVSIIATMLKYADSIGAAFAIFIIGFMLGIVSSIAEQKLGGSKCVNILNIIN